SCRTAGAWRMLELSVRPRPQRYGAGDRAFRAYVFDAQSCRCEPDDDLYGHGFGADAGDDGTLSAPDRAWHQRAPDAVFRGAPAPRAAVFRAVDEVAA